MKKITNVEDFVTIEIRYANTWGFDIPVEYIESINIQRIESIVWEDDTDEDYSDFIMSDYYDNDGGWNSIGAYSENLSIAINKKWAEERKFKKYDYKINALGILKEWKNICEIILIYEDGKELHIHVPCSVRA